MILYRLEENVRKQFNSELICSGTRLTFILNQESPNIFNEIGITWTTINKQRFSNIAHKSKFLQKNEIFS